ncbi:MAG: hypothetical protein Q8934_21740 [Bacillota bacterium]|nr:hypothetical protein [Bacillota bacterium]
MNTTNVSIQALNGAQALTATPTAALSTDGKALTITLASPDYLKGNYSVVVGDAVKTSNEVSFAPYTTIFSANDTTAPTVSSVSSTTNGATPNEFERMYGNLAA